MKPKRGRPPKTSLPRVPSVKLDLHRDTKQSLGIVFFIALALLTLLSLFDISGNLGKLSVRGLRNLFGWGAYILPGIFFLIAASLYKQLHREEDEEKKSSAHSYVGVGLLLLVIITLLQLIASSDASNQFAVGSEGSGGGLLGATIAFLIIKTIGPWAGYVFLVAGAVASILIAFNLTIRELLLLTRKSKNENKEKLIRDNNDLQINGLNAGGFKVEKVGKVNPVAEALSKTAKPLPKFMSRPQANLPGRPMPMKSPSLPSRPKVDKTWLFPAVNLLDESNSAVDSGDIEANVAIIQKTLADFEIEVEMGEVNVGPTVTQYTLRPAEGVRLSAIVALQNDLKLALAASSIRIEAPIPGRSLVGIEVPNRTTAAVRLRELFEAEEFQSSPSPLAFVIGRDVAGKAVIEDLAKMPHLLIAGATGSGKSVCINVFLTSLLMRNTPRDVKFIIIDPKRVEMSLYNGMPHLITPIITDHQKAVNALKWAVAEMDRRYHLLAEARKRNIGEYNEAAPDPLSYLVIIVDELADLMSLARNDVETTIVRLAQMARAVGIHLVLATQRPSVDIITGLIKANITSRIAFAVASQIDSRTIIDQGGAEKLLGRGDLLYITAEMSQPRRLQGALISEKEVKKVTDFLKKEGEPSYDVSVTEKIMVKAADHEYSMAGDSDDPIVLEAKKVVTEAGKASASLLQRRLRIGYARAARILDILEEQGIVGPAEGAKPREVYGLSGDSADSEMNDGDNYS